MKIIKNGDVYRKLNWFEEHELKLYEVGIVVVGFACLVLLKLLIRG